MKMVRCPDSARASLAAKGLRIPSVLMLAAALLSGMQPCAQAASSSAHSVPVSAHEISYDQYSMKIDGKRIYLWSGSFHYWRLPSPSLWEDVLQKMKAAGFNGVEIYFDWDYHSPRRGVYDFSGIRNVDLLLDMANRLGIYVIARPGPYINAETDGGGFPSWLTTIQGKARSPAPDYTAAYQEWLTQIDAILARHQLTTGQGTVILYQVENEFYDNSSEGRRYMQEIERKARQDGISVPLSGNHNASFQDGIGAVDVPGYDSYPLGFDCSRPEQWASIYDYSPERLRLTRSPLFFPEFQGGSFDSWGAGGYDLCRRLTGVDFERVFYQANIAAGSTMQNFYMTYGGINWGWLASPGLYTSYDYAAAISVDRRLTSKYAQQKRLGYFVQAVAPLTKTDRIGVRMPSNPVLRLDGRINPDEGTRFYILRHADAQATGDDTTRVSLDTSPLGASQPDYVTVPQQPGSNLHVNGRDSKIMLVNYRYGHQQMVYSTSELMTQLSDGDRDIAVLYGRHNEDGETVLKFRSKPVVQVLSGQVETRWDAASGRLRLNYRHRGLARVLIQHGTQSLLLLLAEDQATDRLWQVDTPAGAVLVNGPYLVRSATIAGDGLALTGDTDHPAALEIFAPANIARVIWNGRPVATHLGLLGNRLAQLEGPQPVTLPQLTNWKHHSGAPEILPGFNDSDWREANKQSTYNPDWNGKLPILNGDEYGFHHGNLWYRGHFVASGKEQGVILGAKMGVHLGNQGIFAAWLNGHYLGSHPSGARYFAIDPSYLRPGSDNVLSVLVDNMGHSQEEYSGAYKEPRGLTEATLVGSPETIQWRLQGTRGGEAMADSLRGPMNNGGLYGEREGWSLPNYPDQSWQTVALPQQSAKPGVEWYRTSFRLAIPVDQDVPVSLRIDDTSLRHYRVLIFVNGWQLGRYINGVGPQHEFDLPPGLLNPEGLNTVALAVWNTGYDGGMGQVSLIATGNYRSALRVQMVGAAAQ